ncbi:MAG TPA: hypothetical protein VF752_12870 [Thermoleophilaceae bacterium]
MPITASGKIYNVEPGPDEPARLGAIVNSLPLGGIPGFTLKIPVEVAVRPTDYGLDTTIDEIPRTAPGGVSLNVKQMDITLDGTPAGGSGPFMTNPTRCGAATTTVDAASYAAPASFSSNSATYNVTGCSSLPTFAPTLSVTRASSRADTPTAYTIAVNVPGGQSHVKRTEVVLPRGTTLSPPSAEGMSACTDGQFAKATADTVACPGNSELGTVTINTPLLGVLNGKVWLGTPTADAPLRLFVGVQEHGLSIKVIGLVTPNPADGQVTTVFDDLPQTPFTTFALSFRGGDRAILANPVECGSYTATARVTPWSGQPDATPTSAPFPVDDDGAGGACPAKRPFTPTLQAIPGNTQAGHDPGSLDLVVDRPDRDQRLKGLKFSLAPGLLGKVAGVPLCGNADAATGNCPANSRVGTVTAAVGSGGAPTPLSGPVYFGGPYNGGIASLIVVLPGKVGPLDVGTTVLRSALKLRGTDGGIDVTSDDLPQFVGGIPTAIRHLSVKLDRPGMLLNPTSCAPLQVVGHFTSAEGDTADPTAPFQATGCEKLPFNPGFSAVAGGRGETNQLRHPFLRTVITQKEGEAAQKSVAVTLPPTIGPDLEAVGRACPQAVAATATCPPSAKVGTATASSPLLPLPLAGPVYLVQIPGQAFPGVLLDLKGLLDLKLNGRVTGTQKGLVTVFDSVPDVPIGKFELAFDGGPKGSLVAVRDLCASTQKVSAAFTAHSGATRTVTSPLLVSGCATKASLTLSGVKKKKPRLDLRTRGFPNSAGFERLELRMPRSLKGVSRKAKRGVRVLSGSKRVRGMKATLRGSRLVLTGLPKDTQSLRVIVIGGALKPAKSLLSAFQRHRKPRLTFKLLTREAGERSGTSTAAPAKALTIRPRS